MSLQQVCHIYEILPINGGTRPTIDSHYYEEDMPVGSLVRHRDNPAAIGMVIDYKSTATARVNVLWNVDPFPPREVFRINSSGQLGIGVRSPGTSLSISPSTTKGRRPSHS